MVEVAPVQQQAVAAGQEFVGTVFPTRTAVIGSAVDGRVIEFPINEGDRVEAGQTLAQLLTETISLELQAAEAELQLRQEEWNELNNGSRSEEIEQSRARVEAARGAGLFDGAGDAQKDCSVTTRPIRGSRPKRVCRKRCRLR